MEDEGCMDEWMGGGSRVCALITPGLRSPLSSHSAIYLCKRTMQNKTRLELADYEAVSAGLLL